MYRAYDYIQRQDISDGEKEKQISRLKRFCEIIQGTPAKVGMHEEWAFKFYQYLNNEHITRVKNGKAIARTEVGGKEEASGGSNGRSNLYLKANRVLHYHMNYEPFTRKSQIRASSTEHFPFAEEAHGLKKRIAEKKARKNEKEILARNAREKIERKRLLAGMSKEDIQEILKDEHVDAKKVLSKSAVEAEPTEV